VSFAVANVTGFIARAVEAAGGDVALALSLSSWAKPRGHPERSPGASSWGAQRRKDRCPSKAFTAVARQRSFRSLRSLRMTQTASRAV